ncbi:MAG: helix-hairpin-helix domain-containing protein, partial [Balneolaceae bacterium]|nr:helix-hairpin-helix domain-containing protein [Balneolaceae bacterium]
MWKTVTAIVFSPLIACAFAHAQTSDTLRNDVQERLERRADDFDAGQEPEGAEQLTQLLHDLAANPVNINLAGIDELLRVPGLDLRRGLAITEYRETVKPFETVEELVEVPGIGAATLDRIRPFVTVGSGAALRRALYANRRYWTSGGRFEAYSRFQQTLQQQEGYRRPDSTGYIGSPVSYYQRFRYRSGHISANLTQ